MKIEGEGKRILIVDDFNLYRRFFAEGLRQSSGFEVLEAATAEEALSQMLSGSPDVILLNLSMRHCSGMALLQFIHRQFASAGLLTFSNQHHDHLLAKRAICAGASGYISLDESGEALLEAVDVIAAGGVYLAPSLRKKIGTTTHMRGKKQESPFERLSHREFEVFCLTGHGHMPKQIAELLRVSVKTVETYRERIREKLGLSDGGELLYHAASFIRERSSPYLS